MKRKIFKVIKIVGIIFLATTAIFTILVIVSGRLVPILEKREEDDDEEDEIFDVSCCSFIDDDEI